MERCTRVDPAVRSGWHPSSASTPTRRSPQVKVAALRPTRASLPGRCGVVANHGMRPEQPYVHDVVGRNFRMTNLVAAVGLGQLDRWTELLAARGRICRLYDELLDSSMCAARPVADWASYGPWLHTITANQRSTVLSLVRKHGIDARAIWPTLSSQPLSAWSSSVALRRR